MIIVSYPYGEEAGQEPLARDPLDREHLFLTPLTAKLLHAVFREAMYRAGDHPLAPTRTRGLEIDNSEVRRAQFHTPLVELEKVLPGHLKRSYDHLVPAQVLCWVLQYVPVSPEPTEEDLAAVMLAVEAYYDSMGSAPGRTP